MLVTRGHLKRNNYHPCLGGIINGSYPGEHLPTIVLSTTSKSTYKLSSKRVVRVGYLLVTRGYALENSKLNNIISKSLSVVTHITISTTVCYQIYFSYNSRTKLSHVFHGNRKYSTNLN